MRAVFLAALLAGVAWRPASGQACNCATLDACVLRNPSAAVVGQCRTDCAAQSGLSAAAAQCYATRDAAKRQLSAQKTACLTQAGQARRDCSATGVAAGTGTGALGNGLNGFVNGLGTNGFVNNLTPAPFVPFVQAQTTLAPFPGNSFPGIGQPNTFPNTFPNTLPNNIPNTFPNNIPNTLPNNVGQPNSLPNIPGFPNLGTPPPGIVLSPAGNNFGANTNNFGANPTYQQPQQFATPIGRRRKRFARWGGSSAVRALFAQAPQLRTFDQCVRTCTQAAAQLQGLGTFDDQGRGRGGRGGRGRGGRGKRSAEEVLVSRVKRHGGGGGRLDAALCRQSTGCANGFGGTGRGRGSSLSTACPQLATQKAAVDSAFCTCLSGSLGLSAASCTTTTTNSFGVFFEDDDD